ncbi:NAC domain-containing protein 53-like [Apium graveolens]|uniref:NAC domain-containing protein 53-like n=1 Tax=Apium graveolens TaxID=4045 RepID=UPI003D7925DE
MDLDAKVTVAARPASSSLAPGFRFHPTDEELVRYYLRRKICGKPFRFDAISDIDIYKVEPWDLPGKSRLKSRDLEWYFFSYLDKKYGNGSRTNRATDGGYWKTTGKDRAVYHRTKVVGMKKTLVYHSGRAPRGERTNWVMHEYRLIDEELEKTGILQDAFVLCRVFRKSGSGPKNGEKYGAPFVEEEWEDDELAMVPKDEYADEHQISDDAYLDENDLEEILSAADPVYQSAIPLNVYGAENQYVAGSTNFIDEPQEPLGEVDETNYLQEQPDDPTLSNMHSVDESNYFPEQPDGTTLFNLPVQSNMDTISVKHEYIFEPSYIGASSNAENPADVDYLLNEPPLDAMDNPQYVDGSFIENSDLKPSVEADPSSFEMLDEYLQFFDSTDGNLDYSNFDFPNTDYADGNLEYPGLDHSNIVETGDLPSEPASLLAQDVMPKDVNENIKQETVEGTVPPEGHNGGENIKQDIVEGSLLPGGQNNDIPSSSNAAESDFPYQFSKHASRVLGNYPAPPAFASEFPRKDAALRFNSASPSSIHVTAGIIQIRNMSLRGTGISWSYGKDGRLNVVLSFGLSRVDDISAESEPASSIIPNKAHSAVYRGWFYFMCMWVLFLTMSFKIGSYICAK